MLREIEAQYSLNNVRTVSVESQGLCFRMKENISSSLLLQVLYRDKIR